MSNKTGINFFENSFCEQYLTDSLNSEDLEAEENALQRNKEVRRMIRNAFKDMGEDNPLANDTDNSYFASESNCNSINQTGYQNQSKPDQLTRKTPKKDNEYKLTGCSVDLLPSLCDDAEFKQQKQNIEDILKKLITVDVEKDDNVLSCDEINKLLSKSRSQLAKAQEELENDIKKLESSENVKIKNAVEDTEKSYPVGEVMQKNEENDETKVASKYEEEDFGHQIEEFKSKTDNTEDLQSILKEKLETANRISEKLRTSQNDMTKTVKWNDTINDQSLFLNEDEGSGFIFAPCKNSSELSLGLVNAAPECGNFTLKENSNLFDDFHEDFGGLKEKDSEIQFLKERLELCSEHIKSLKEDESKYISKIKQLKKENNNLNQKVKDLSADKQNIEEYNNKIRSYENRIMDSEKQIKELKEENETLKRSLEQNHDIPNILSDSSYSKELRKKLENCLQDCSTLKSMYIDVCSTKDQLQIQKGQFEQDLSMQKYENSLLNNLVKALVKDKENSLKLNASQSRLSCQLKNHENDQEKESTSSDPRETEELHNKLVICEQELENARDHIRQLELFKIEIMDHVAKTDAFHQEKLTLLQEEHSEQIRTLNADHKENALKAESELKETIRKVYATEIDRLTETYKGYFKDMKERIFSLEKQLENRTQEDGSVRNQLVAANEELTALKSEFNELQSKYNDSADAWSGKFKTMTEKQEKLHSEIDKIYNKYKTVRKKAVELKQLLNSRSRMLQKHHEYYVKTLKEVQTCLNGTFDFNLREKTADNVVATATNEKHSFNTDAEIDGVVNAIKKQLEFLNHR